MSGSPHVIGGIHVTSFQPDQPGADPYLASVLYQVATLITTDPVRNELLGAITSDPDSLPKSTIESGGSDVDTPNSTITNEFFQAYVPGSTATYVLATELSNAAICLTLFWNSEAFHDKKLQATVKASAQNGYQKTLDNINHLPVDL